MCSFTNAGREGEKEIDMLLVTKQEDRELFEEKHYNRNKIRIQSTIIHHVNHLELFSLSWSPRMCVESLLPESAGTF